MSDPSPDRVTSPLPRDALFALLPASFEPWGRSTWFASRPPTPASVRRIEAETGLTLPPLFVEIAAACPSYGGWFGSIGEDFESQNHLLVINRQWHEAALPPRYVMLNHGHDGYCDAWDRDAVPPSDAGRAICSFTFEWERPAIQHLRIAADSFETYIDRFVRVQAPRCPEKTLRRKAKRLLAGL